MKWPSALLLLLAAIIEHVYSHTVEVPAGNKECFFEDLHVNDQVRLVYGHPSNGRADL